MADLGLTQFNQIFPMLIRKYDNLIIDQNANERDKINQIINKLNALGKLSNDVVKNWNVVYNWAMNDGLTTDVSNKIETMKANGELTTVLQGVFNALTGDMTTLHTNAKDTLVNSINEVDDLAKSNQTKMGDLTTLQTADKDTIVHAINDNVASLAQIATQLDSFPIQVPETDDSARFTRCLNSLPSTGGKIILSQGKTYTGNFLINKSNIRLTGGGILKGVIQLYGTDTTGISRFDPSATGDIYIDGITIDGEKTRNGITCKWVFGVTITNVTFKHCVKSINFEPIAQTQHCSRFTITNNRLWDCNYGLYVDWNSQLSTNSPTMPYGVGDITYSNNVHESRNSGWDGTFGNIYHIWAKGLDGLVCRGNTFFFAGLAGETSNIYLELFNWIHIEGNQLFVPPQHAIHAYNGSNLIIRGNNVAWSGLEAIFLDTITTFVVDSNNLVWKDNSATLANLTGVLVQNSSFALGNISNNSMYFPNEYAVHIINSSYINITGNMSRNKYATGAAVQLDTLTNCNDIIISGNNFTNYPTTVHSAISTRQSQQRIFYNANNEGVSSFLSDGVFLPTRTTTISASQTSLDGGNYDQFNFNNSSAHTVSSLTNGYEGKEILFVAFNGNTTISNTAANLKGAVSVTLANKNTMKLKYTAGAWYEIARNF